MISALIIDDEESTVNVLKLLLQLHVPEISNIETAIGAASGLHALKESQPDIVFLDIEMPLMSGFELLEQFPNHFFEVIFVTPTIILPSKPSGTVHSTTCSSPWMWRS